MPSAHSSKQSEFMLTFIVLKTTRRELARFPQRNINDFSTIEVALNNFNRRVDIKSKQRQKASDQVL